MLPNASDMHSGSIPTCSQRYLLEKHSKTSDFYNFSIILTETRIFEILSFYIVLSQSVLPKMTVGVVGSFHGFGTKLNLAW